jgi:serine/threonine protein kinase/Leucine-rich repeat (LRR) protein
MAIDLEAVVKQLADSGIIAPGKLENFIPPKATPKDGETLLRELHKQKLLTTFQAQQVAANKTKALLLGNYLLIDKIGAGGMGQVFKAEHRRMKRAVAIKMLPKAMLKDPAAAARFQREVEAAAKLSHPNIVAAYDADEANGVHFLVMEYVAGNDLSVLVKKNGPLPVGKAVDYILQAARGLEFAHQKGVIHRDIKPANLLLSSDGTVKILDMGLARIESDGNAATQAELTGTGAVMGTVDYMAPEQGLSTKHADARADIYSLGCSLHYLLIGKPTFDGETVTAKLLAHHNSPPPNLCDVRSDVPKQVQTIFAKMVAKKLEDRYQTMTEVIADLEKCQGGLSSSSPSATVKTSSSPDAHTSDITAAFGNRLLQSIPLPERYEEPESKGPPWRNTKLLVGAGAAGFLCLLLGVIVIFRNQKGEEVGRMALPDGTSVEVQTSGPKAAPVVPGKPITTFKDPAFQAWMKEVQAMPAEEQVKAVAKKLMELNPGFDGKLSGYTGVTPSVEKGVVTHLGIVTTDVADISPVRALAGLKKLNCDGIPIGILTDLRPLSGMQLIALRFNHTQVSDLSPLVGMPLDSLECSATKVTDLSPLVGLPLTDLYCGGTGHKIVDWSPLGRMRLTKLSLYGTSGRLPDLAILRDTSIVDLNIGGIAFRSLAPLAGMRLKSLAAINVPIDDLSPLAGMPLESLILTQTRVLDLSPLRGLPLARLYLSDTAVSDLAPLADCKALSSVRAAGTKVTPATVAALQKSLPNCKIEWDDPAKAATSQSNQPWETPAFQQWVKATQALPAEKQIEAVSKKLMELNPGFDGKLESVGRGGTPRVENGVVTGLWLNTDVVADLSPLRALAGLKRLSCGRTHHSKLADLSPLRGLSLEQFTCGHNDVSDLSPLEGMPLTELTVAGTKVSDLSPLRGMPLAHLNFQSSPVTDLSPVRGMRLSVLNCGGSNVSDLSPIAGMPLVTLLTVEPQKITKGIEVLRQMSSLQTIGTDGNNQWPAAEFWKKYDAGEFVKPAAPAKLAYLDPAFDKWVKATQALPAEKQVEAVSKKLMELNPGFDGLVTGDDGKGTPKIESRAVVSLGFLTDNVTDISPVRALPELRLLTCSGSGGGKGKLSDLSPLAGMPLAYLKVNGTKVVDLSPLQGTSLRDLNFGQTPVADLSPLKGLGLSTLTAHQTHITDLSPLRGMPLSQLIVAFTQIADLSPLDDCKSLKNLVVTNTKATPAQVAALQRALPNCKIEWDDPAKAATTQPNPHWNTPAFQKWVKETQALPAEQQIEAVSKKLMELNPGFDGKVTAWSQNGPPKIENGVVTELQFLTHNVSDISPVRALAGLKVLVCSGSNSIKGKLSDVSPLQGMPLTQLRLDDTLVADLSPLKGMPLTKLLCNATHVSDLSPLAGMPPTELGCGGTQIADLSPLRGMKLTSLRCHNTSVADLSPLEGAPLTTLACGGAKISDLSPLRGMKLTSFDCMLTPVSDLSPLAGMQLAFLQFTPKRITKGMDVIRRMTSVQTIATANGDKFPPDEFWKKYDAGEFGKPAAPAKLAYLEPAFQLWVKATQALPAEKQLEAVSKKLMELNPGFDGKLIAPVGGDTSKPRIKNGVVTELALRSKELSDLSPLRALVGLQMLRTNCSSLVDLSPLTGMSITTLTVEGCKVTDLSPLAQLPLESLGLYGTRVSDLRPIDGLRLTFLNVMGTAVTDLSPLRGKPIKTLGCLGTAVSDLSPLHDCPDLTSLNVRQTKVTPASVAALQKALPNCKVEWDDPAKAATTQPNQPWNTPAFQAWVKEVQAMPAEKQVEAVSKKLVELNPGFDGKLTGAYLNPKPTIENGVVTALGFLVFDVTDISPVRALPGLQALFCGGSGPRMGKLSDLSPLSGMQLTFLSCYQTQVSDLTPLKGMPLSGLLCHVSRVSDLSPIQGMPLTNLNISNTAVSDLSSLKGMKLTLLHFGNSKVTDISILRGMPLTSVYGAGPQVSDFSPLEDCKSLKTLDLRLTKVTPAQVAALQKALPNCKIDWDDPTKPKTPEPAAAGTK